MFSRIYGTSKCTLCLPVRWGQSAVIALLPINAQDNWILHSYTNEPSELKDIFDIKRDRLDVSKHVLSSVYRAIRISYLQKQE